jgi:hypothetical protein
LRLQQLVEVGGRGWGGGGVRLGGGACSSLWSWGGGGCEGGAGAGRRGEGVKGRWYGARAAPGWRRAPGPAPPPRCQPPRPHLGEQRAAGAAPGREEVHNHQLVGGLGVGWGGGWGGARGWWLGSRRPRATGRRATAARPRRPLPLLETPHGRGPSCPTIPTRSHPHPPAPPPTPPAPTYQHVDQLLHRVDLGAVGPARPRVPRAAALGVVCGARAHVPAARARARAGGGASAGARGRSSARRRGAARRAPGRRAGAARQLAGSRRRWPLPNPSAARAAAAMAAARPRPASRACLEARRPGPAPVHAGGR